MQRQDYFCEKCGLQSVIEHVERATVFEVVNQIEADHKTKSPDCEQEVRKIRIIHR